jgi:SAM-dependent methyltransferase
VVERLGTLRLFLDLGTGNGHLLFELAAAIAAPGRTYTGVDYSPESVAFARTLARDRDGAFAFEQVDLLADDPFLSRTFDVLLDKGTLDAIALNPHPLADGRTGMEAYAPQVRRMMHRGLTLLVTSCNYTAPELERLICAETDLEAFDRIAYPSFRFGGVQGTTICSIAFRVRGNVQA